MVNLRNLHVPNVPCGVESCDMQKWDVQRKTFLMHRVELKGEKLADIVLVLQVPNAPCGVERKALKEKGLIDLGS